MGTNDDHIHYMIETNPNTRLSDFVRTIKSFTTFHIWKNHNLFLAKHFWIECTFWSDGNFICSVGNVSEEMLRRYTENQGWHHLAWHHIWERHAIGKANLRECLCHTRFPEMDLLLFVLTHQLKLMRLQRTHFNYSNWYMLITFTWKRIEYAQ